MTRHRLVFLVVGLSIVAFGAAAVLMLMPISAGPADVALPSCGNAVVANPVVSSRWEGVAGVCASRRAEKQNWAAEFLVIGLAGLAASGLITVLGRLGSENVESGLT